MPFSAYAGVVSPRISPISGAPSASSTTNAPEGVSNARFRSNSGANAKPIRLPRHILNTAAAMPPKPGTIAEAIEPESVMKRTARRTSFRESGSGRPFSLGLGAISRTLAPGRLNSGEITFSAPAVPTAKEMSVGGTSSRSKEPLIESLPPTAAMPRSSCASSAPKSAASGFPQRIGSEVIRSKYSWKVRWALFQSPPEAASRATDSTTALYAPR